MYIRVVIQIGEDKMALMVVLMMVLRGGNSAALAVQVRKPGDQSWSRKMEDSVERRSGCKCGHVSVRNWLTWLHISGRITRHSRISI